jgi:hypothetical protein
VSEQTQVVRPAGVDGEARQVVLVGAGPVAMAIAAAALEDGVATSVAAVVDPADQARTGAVERLGGRGYRTLDELPAGAGQLAVAAFSSRAELNAPVAARLLALGCHAVTTCEELADPPAGMRAELSRAAERSGRSLVVAGANPGFVMDRLPLALAAGCRGIRAVRVLRRLDTRTRRGPLVAKSGYGLTPEAFEAGVETGTVGHVGLEVSARLLAEGLGWAVEGTRASIAPVPGDDGLVAGQHQVLEVDCGQGRSITFDLTMAWGLAGPVDRVSFAGMLGLDAEIVGGYPGDEGTTARVVSALAHVGDLEPGFYRPTDLPFGL